MSDLRVAFLLDAPHLETLPFLREPVLEFERLGAKIDIFMPDSRAFPAPIFEGRGSIRIIGTEFGTTETSLLRALARVTLAALEQPYDLFFATPKNSLLVAACASRLMQRPLVSLCDEIYMLDGDEELRLASAYSDSDLCIITDRTRIPLLKRSLGNMSKLPLVMELPNCPAHSGQSRQPRKMRSGLVRVLNLGFFDRSFGADLIIDSLDRLDPQETEIVVHERANVNKLIQASFPMFRLLQKAYPIDFVLNPVSYEQLPSIVQQFDIGLALYASESDNDNYCGKGSGKLGRYLQHGLPVIVKGPNLRWLEDYGAGKYVDSGEQLALAIEEIRGNYGAFSKRALECYEEHFNLEQYLPPITSQINSLLNRYGPANAGTWGAWVSNCLDLAARLEKTGERGRAQSANSIFECREDNVTPARDEQFLVRALEGLGFLGGIIPARKARGEGPPSSVSNFPYDLTNKALDFGGIYADGWLSQSSFVALGVPSEAEPLLLVRGIVPRIEDDNFATALSVSIDGTILAQSRQEIGTFMLAVEPLRAQSSHFIDLIFTEVQRLPDPDDRLVGAKLEFIGFVYPPNFFSSFDDGIPDVSALRSGILNDGWLTDYSSIILSVPSNSSLLRLRGVIPNFEDEQFSTSLSISVDGKQVRQSSLGPGEFTIETEVFEVGHWHKIELAFDKTQRLPEPDGRAVSARISFVGFVEKSFAGKAGK